ncbi:MAG: LapA family protein [Desulfatiglandales bacterium]
MKSPKVIIGSVVFLLFLVFLFQNMEDVTLRLYFWKISMPQIILIPLCIVLGFLLGYLASGMIRKKRTGPKVEQ